jgi:hypothetical protein
MSARLARYEQGIQQMQQEVAEAINHVTLAVNDLGDPRRREPFSTPSTDRNLTNGAPAPQTADR